MNLKMITFIAHALLQFLPLVNLVAHSLVKTSQMSVRDKMMELTAWMHMGKTLLCETDA